MMEAAGATSVTYSIDETDRIREVGGRWDAFATDNDGRRAVAHHVLGTLLWDHITGSDARRLHRAFIEAVRGRGAIVVPFRCDAPDRRRYMELAARSEDGWVHFTSRLVHEELRPTVEILAGIGSARPLLEICSQCRRVFTPGGWREIEDAVQYMDLYGSETLPALRETACFNCEDAVQSLAGD